MDTPSKKPEFLTEAEKRQQKELDDSKFKGSHTNEQNTSYDKDKNKDPSIKHI